MTMYLAYKLALRNGEEELAARCLESISASSSTDLSFLYACCMEAQECGNKICALQALRQLSEKHQFSQPGPVHFPALLRVMIRLQVSILNEEGLSETDRGYTIQDLCETFEGGKLHDRYENAELRKMQSSRYFGRIIVIKRAPSFSP
jgi:hypothetical protein